MYSDGILINNTAKTIAPYLFEWYPGTPDGLNYIPQKKIEWWLTELEKIGYGAHIHTIGDMAVRESLNAIEAVRSKGSLNSYTLTHLEMVDQRDIPRFVKLDVTADFQLGGDLGEDQNHSWAYPYIGEKRAHKMLPMRPIFDTGANVTLSSDWDVNPLSPLASISNTVALKDRGMPDVFAAIDAYTIHAAEALGLVNITGSIEVGKSADFVWLNKDITKLSPQQIKQAKVLMTILEGQIVFQARE